MAILSGITVPFSFSDSGGVTSSDPLTKIKNNIETVILTMIGSRFMEPSYGSNVPKYIGEISDSVTQSTIIKDIVTQLALFVPEIQIIRVEFVAETESTANNLYIAYSVTAFEVTDEMLLLL